MKKLILLILLILLINLASAALTDRLIACWELDEGTGDAVDAHNDKTLTESGTVSNQSGHLESARGAYSSANYFSNTTVFTLNDDVTFSTNAWVWRSGEVTEARFISVNDATSNKFYFNMRIDTAEKIRVCISKWGVGCDIDITSSFVIPDETWTMVTFTYRSSTKAGKLYMNAKLNGSATATGQGGTDSTAFSVGKELGWAGAPFVDGYIDSVSYFDIDLSQSDIDELWNSGSGFACPFVADTCTCPGAGNNWEIDMSDSCNITTACDLTTGTLSFTGSGYCNCNASVDTTNLGDPGSGGTLFIQNSCLITID